MVGSVLAPECVIVMPDADQLLGLDHKSALITGAGSGIDQAIAETFAARGACVHVLAIDPGKARNIVDRITASGRKAAAHVCDASDESAIAEV
jgi:NAD(P)-dependent dehydrogenase (short-subunit alcohol dehydrogenase family)